MHVAQKTKTKTDKYLAIHLESLRINSILEFDLYIKQAGETILYRAAHLPFTEKNRSNLLENNIKRLYVSNEKFKHFQKYIEANISQIIEDPSVDETAKASIVYDSTKLLVKDVLSNPTLKKNIRRSQAMVESTVSFILKGTRAFHNLLKMMSFDYYTYTHSVNVCTFSLALAQHAGISNIDELYQIGTGALLHDVGKTRISEAILKKETPLTEDEMDLIKKHPEWGYEILKETDVIEEKSYYPILQHHERENGTGYPKCLKGKNIHLYSKITAIADSFDAMTTRRTYRHAMNSFTALRNMFDHGEAYEKTLLRQFARLMGPAPGKDPKNSSSASDKSY